MSDMKISIIIAVYNVEDYVRECIQSVINQDFDSYEIIVVDDGSTDSSGTICDEYKSDRLSVYHKTNSGVSGARNFGLSKAQGEYILYVDGDDYLFPDACKSLYDEAKGHNADIVIGKAQLNKPLEAMERFERIAETSFVLHKAYTGKEYLMGCLQKGALRVEVWRNLYRREYLLENKIYFKMGISHEDEEFTPKSLLPAETVVLTDKVFYFYNNDRASSLMNSSNPQRALDKMLIYEEQLSFYKKIKPRKLRRLLEDDISWKYIDCYATYKTENVKLKRFLPLRCAYHFKRRLKGFAFAIYPKAFKGYK